MQPNEAMKAMQINDDPLIEVIARAESEFYREPLNSFSSLPEALAAAVRSFMGSDEADALRAIHSAVSEYLPPDGIEAKECMSKILAVLDKPAIADMLGRHNDGRT